jgi:hypothetical protein
MWQQYHEAKVAKIETEASCHDISAGAIIYVYKDLYLLTHTSLQATNVLKLLPSRLACAEVERQSSLRERAT